MENVEVFESFEQGVEHLSRLFRVQPELIAHDMHPGYFTTRYAEEQTNLPRVPVQHHHAHIAACMADNGLTDRKLIGLSFDGTVYGTDGRIWGGEVLLASYADFERASHLEYLPLPGGDTATRYPWRIAVGYAEALGLDTESLPFLGSLESESVEMSGFGRFLANSAQRQGEVLVALALAGEGRTLQVATRVNTVTVGMPEDIASRIDIPNCSFQSGVAMLGSTNTCAARKASGQIYDRLFFRHWDTWSDGRRSHVFVMPTEGGEPVVAMKGLDTDAPSKPFGGDDISPSSAESTSLHRIQYQA